MPGGNTRSCASWSLHHVRQVARGRKPSSTKKPTRSGRARSWRAFYEEGSRCTELFPQTGAPSVLRKRKFILYALEDTGRTASLVELKSEDLPEKTSLMMYHVGSQTLDFVSRGLKEGVFSHPAC